MVVVVVELDSLPVLHPGEAAGSRVPVRSGPVPGRMILVLEKNPVGVAEGAAEGQGEAGDDDPQDGSRQRQRNEHGTRCSGDQEMEENANEEAGKKRAEDEGALPAGMFCPCMFARGTRLEARRCGAFGNLFQDNLRGGSV